MCVCVCVNPTLSMVKPYKVGDSVICDNLISIETRGKPIILKSSSDLLSANKLDQDNMANESATVNTTASSGERQKFIARPLHTVVVHFFFVHI